MPGDQNWLRWLIGLMLVIPATLLPSVDLAIHAAPKTALPQPIACWPGDGNAADASSSNSASLFGGATYIAGRIGQAFSFNGSTAYAGQPLPSAMRSPHITLAAWVFLNSTAQGQTILFGEPSGANQFGLGAGLQLYPGGVAAFTKGSGDGSWEGVAASTPIPAGEWRHVSGTYDGATMTIYIDGVPRGSQANAQGINWTDDVRVGMFPKPGQLYFGAFKTNQVGPGATAPDSSVLKLP